MIGYIKLHRQLLEWEWWHDANTTRLWLYLLLAANYEDDSWHGIEAKRGQLVTTRSQLATATGMSDREVRTSLEKLAQTGEILTSSYAKRYTVVTICKYDDYQVSEYAERPTDEEGSANKRPTTRPLNDQQNAKVSAVKTSELDDLFANNEPTERQLRVHQTTSTKEIKNIKNKRAYAENVKMTEDEYGKLVAKYGQEQTDWMVNKLNLTKGSTGRSYKSDYLAILNWVVGAYSESHPLGAAAPRVPSGRLTSTDQLI